MAHKRKHHSMHHKSHKHGKSMHYGGRAEHMESNSMPHRMKAERPHNKGRGPVSEDWSRPCGIPYGAISRDVGQGYNSAVMSARVVDNFEGVNRNMTEDMHAMRSLVDPVNW